MPEPTQQPEAKYILEDMDIAAVGLVQNGANMEKFLLLKAQEVTMPEELVIEELPDTPDASSTFWDKIKKFVSEEIAKAKGTAAKASPMAIAQAAKLLGMSPAALADKLEMGDEENDEDAVDTEAKGKKPMKKGEKDTPEGEEAPVTESVTKSIDEQLAELQKAQEARIAELEKAMTAKYEAKIAELAKQADTAKEEVAKATEARERREWIEKSEQMTLALPVKKEELADHLYAISKAAPDHIEWLVGTLKAADHAMTEAGLFSELGTTRTEQVEAIEKAERIAKEQKISLADALLQLSPDEQAEIVGDFLGGE